ncbi:flagellar basal body P-ring formation chaperone FlgA [Chitinimonas lacunae]|uniref:Flagellar basal body P-ring formation chaperone FlgA n=1 Tax=Chitinimonas lacunae TaxID=1963018 RepID=A0ABV8MWU0_9NEIS
MLSLGLHAAEPAATLTLRERVVLPGSSLRLGDLAEVKGEAALVAVLRELPLGEAPRAGYRDRRLRSQLARLVDARLPSARRRLLWQGSEQVEIEVASQRYAGARLIEAASVSLQRTLEAEGGRVEISPAGAVADLELPPGTVTLTARMTPGSVPRSRLSVWVDLSVDGRFVRSQTVPLRLTLWRPVWRARAALAREALLDCGQLERVEVDVAALAAVPFGPDCTAGLRIRHPIAAGETLLASRVEAAPAVRQGQNVVLELASGAVRIEAAAVALADAQLGQPVRVRPSHADEPVQARVVAAGRVVAQGDREWK